MSNSIVTLDNEEYIVTIEESGIQILEICKQGVPGPPGQDGGNTVTYTAGTALSGQRAVVFSNSTTVIYANSSDITHRNKYAGVTTAAASSGSNVLVQRIGNITEGSWNWVVGNPIFFTSTGVLTQTVPTSGFSMIIGVATSATTIFLSPREPITII